MNITASQRLTSRLAPRKEANDHATQQTQDHPWGARFGAVRQSPIGHGIGDDGRADQQNPAKGDISAR